MDARKIVKQFLVTEKSTIIRERDRTYSFAVDGRANKYQIKDAVEQLFDVQVDSVRTVVIPGKLKRLGRFEGKTPSWKKAIVKLKGDQQISEFENL
jgi:large subunit ribosomal protein L23